MIPQQGGLWRFGLRMQISGKFVESDKASISMGDDGRTTGGRSDSRSSSLTASGGSCDSDISSAGGEYEYLERDAALPVLPLLRGAGIAKPADYAIGMCATFFHQTFKLIVSGLVFQAPSSTMSSSSTLFSVPRDPTIPVCFFLFMVVFKLNVHLF
jgi:hypothetical protein